MPTDHRAIIDEDKGSYYFIRPSMIPRNSDLIGCFGRYEMDEAVTIIMAFVHERDKGWESFVSADLSLTQNKAADELVEFRLLRKDEDEYRFTEYMVARLFAHTRK
jgi:hypothetical protein